MIANELQEGQVYKTCESELEYFAKLVSKADGKAKLSVFMPKSGKWKELEVPGEYKLRELNDLEKDIYAKIEEKAAKRKARGPRVPKDPNAPKRAAIKKVNGAVSGLGMLKCWATYIDKFAREEGGRSKVIEAMIAEFPTKGESINKWVNAYLTYYNAGRFATYGFPLQTKRCYWVLSEAEKAAGVIVNIRKPKAVAGTGAENTAETPAA